MPAGWLSGASGQWARSLHPLWQGAQCVTWGMKRCWEVRGPGVGFYQSANEARVAVCQWPLPDLRTAHEVLGGWRGALKPTWGGVRP